jgi:cobalt/nickel transport system permease protein
MLGHMDTQAMHIANGIVNGPVSAVFAVVAIAALTFCVRRARADLDDRCVSTVLIVQCLLFADGGLTALGLNITNMALIGTVSGYLMVVAMLKLLPRTPAGIAVTAFAASVVSVVVASQGFVLEYAAGGTTQLSLPTISLAMAGVHTLIGIGEGLITATTVVTVARVRPDLVYALRRFRTPADTPTVGANA